MVVVGLTFIDDVVWPVDQEYVVPPDAVKVVDNPSHIVGEFTVIVGVVFTVKLTVLEFTDWLQLLVIDT